tara:strand:- start:203 stop:574 length:372 start_codon:yes stop_codon:yes gene_type:complete
MNLIIKKGNFNTNRIHIKNGKKCNKILYNLDYVSMIGITLNVENEEYVEDVNFIYIDVKDYQLKYILNEIDSLMKKNYGNYLSFLSFNKIKVKKHSNFKKMKNISINNIKLINNKAKVQIFTI